MNLSDFYSEISRTADTLNQHIGVDEVSRVMAKCFDVLKDKSPEYVCGIIVHGIEHARTHKLVPSQKDTE